MRRLLSAPSRLWRRLTEPGTHTHVIVFDAGRPRPREFRLSGRFRRVAVVAGLVLLGGAGHYTFLLFGEGGAPTALREERDALRELARGYAVDTERMAARVETLETRMRRLAVLAGEEPIAERIGGLGGSSNPGIGYDYVNARLERLSTRIALLDRQGLALERAAREKSELISRTPSIWPVRGYVSSRFGRRPDPFTGAIEWHAGLDISTKTGAPVRSTADGVVIGATTSATYGKQVSVSHGFGVETRYAHLSRIDVRPGQRIQRGHIVGLVGNTGRSQSPHLHYEVLVNGRPRNPLDHIIDYTP